MVHHPNSVADGLAFNAHGILPGFVIKAQRVLIGIAMIEPEGTLPTADLPHNCALVAEHIIERRLVHRSARRHQTMRIGNCILQAIVLSRAGRGIILRGPGTKPARVPGGQVPFGLTFCQPLSHCFADGCRMGNANLHAGCVIEILDTPCRPHQRQRVRRIRDRTIHKPLRACVGQEWHMDTRRLKHRHHALDVIGEQLMIEVLRHAILPNRPPVMGVRPQQKRVTLAAQIET